MISRVFKTSSHVFEGSISYGRLYERGKLNSQLVGVPYSSPNGALPESRVIDAGITGSFTPSWVRTSLGQNHSAVVTVLSASDHESQALNYYRSGSQAVENGPVPASGTLYSSKQQRYMTVTVKKSASIFDTLTGGPPAPGNYVPRSFVAGSGSLVSVVTGSNGVFSGSIGSPATITLNVPVSGRLVDIRIWVELIQLSGSIGQAGVGLVNLGVALRSPNVSFGSSHPIRNDERLILADKNIFGASGIYEPQAFNHNSFILWEGKYIFDQPGSYDGGKIMAMYPSWDLDRGMRTIFSDSAQTPNPRHLYDLTSPSGNYIGSPNAGRYPTGSAYGNNTPWTSDASYGPGNESGQAAGSPPNGWLNGPGGTAAENEWPTTGSNYGANHIRPMYPLLDPIFGKKRIGDEFTIINLDGAGGYGFSDIPIVESWRGFRPGLRGSEISGSWQLLIVADAGITQAQSPQVFFRQARLEITYESSNSSRPKQIRNLSSVQPRRGGPRFLYRISGSDDSNTSGGQQGLIGPYPDWYVTEVWTDTTNEAEIGRTFGIAFDSGSVGEDWALLYRLTGSLSDLSGSAPDWLLNNQFRVPMIPISSASLSTFEVPPPTEAHVQEVILPSKTLDGARRLEDVAADFNPRKSLVQLAATFISSSLS